MKNKLILLFCLAFGSTQGQEWFDKSCKNIGNEITAEAFNASQKRNILNVVINQAGEIEINGITKENISEIAFKEVVLDFITNPQSDKSKADKPENVFIQIKSYNKDSQTENALQTYIQEVYLYLWDKHAEEKYSSTYVDLNCKKRAKVFDKYPLRLVAGIEKKTEKKKPRGVGVPQFKGDVNDN